MQTKATPPLLRNLNERTVLEAIRAGAPISRAEISRRSGISKPTVSQALQSLLEAGLVREATERPDGPGYGAVYFEPVAEAALVLGLDLGARFVRGALCDLAGTVRARQDVELTVAAVPDAVQAIERLRSSLLDASGLDPDRVDGTVVGVPGVVDNETGVLHLAENVAGLEGRPFGSELQNALGQPVSLENDINLAALGEQWQGVARGVDDFVFLSVGTGMGAGLVLGGELHRGRHGAAGEIDFALVGVDERLDPSGPEIAQLASKFAARQADARALFGAARNGDETQPSSPSGRLPATPSAPATVSDGQARLRVAAEDVRPRPAAARSAPKRPRPSPETLRRPARTGPQQARTPAAPLVSALVSCSHWSREHRTGVCRLRAEGVS